MNFSVGLAQDSIPTHKHKNYEIVAYIKGSGVIHFPNRDISASAGTIIIVPPETPHSSTKTTSESERIYISGEFSHILSLNAPTVISDKSAGDGLLLAQMIYADRYAHKEYLASLVNALIHFLALTINSENDVFLAVQTIAETIGNNFNDCSLDVNAQLKKSGYSVDYIRAHFKSITGKTPIEFLTKVRIDHACYLIDLYKNMLSLSDIAERCGFSDYIYFSRRFKQKMGVSPKQYMDNN
jgi:AraC-like DNA-binding protein